MAREVVPRRVPCGKDVKTVRGEPSRYVGKNIPGRGNSKEVTWLGPWSGGRRGRTGQSCSLFGLVANSEESGFSSE